MKQRKPMGCGLSTHQMLPDRTNNSTSLFALKAKKQRKEISKLLKETEKIIKNKIKSSNNKKISAKECYISIEENKELDKITIKACDTNTSCIIGYAYGRSKDKEFFLEQIWITPVCRRLGIGYTLMELVKKYFWMYGYTEIRLIRGNINTTGNKAMEFFNIDETPCDNLTDEIKYLFYTKCNFIEKKDENDKKNEKEMYCKLSDC